MLCGKPKSVKKTTVETLKQTLMYNVDYMELKSPRLSSNSTTSDVISTFLNEEKREVTVVAMLSSQCRGIYT